MLCSSCMSFQTVPSPMAKSQMWVWLVGAQKEPFQMEGSEMGEDPCLAACMKSQETENTTRCYVPTVG